MLFLKLTIEGVRVEFFGEIGRRFRYTCRLDGGGSAASLRLRRNGGVKKSYQQNINRFEKYFSAIFFLSRVKFATLQYQNPRCRKASGIGINTLYEIRYYSAAAGAEIS